MTIKSAPIMPHLPGVYLFKNNDQKVIYVGKAKSLKKRIQSYFHKKDLDWKIKTLIDEHTRIEHIVTANETEALLLEAQLIKDHQPKFNVLLKSGQPFMYLLFTKTPPQLLLVRNRKKKGTYFGPFLHKQQARSVYHYLLKTFKLSSCTKKIAGGCLNFHLDLCSGTCKDDFDQEAFLFRMQLAINLLQGNFKQSKKDIETKIKGLSASLAFEKARSLFEYRYNLEGIFETLQTKYNENKYSAESCIVTAPIKYKTQYNTDLAFILQSFLQTDKPIINIDCFDISHFQSSYLVGSCIRFTHGSPNKNKFRRFKIKTLDKQNDYAALQEIVQRRYRMENDLPDLIVIDGGKGQLNAVHPLIANVPFVSLAKREERLFGKPFTDGIILDIKTEIGKLFIALRDYAHHFAISYHRLRRMSETKRSYNDHSELHGFEPRTS